MLLILFDVDGTLVYSHERRDSRCFANAYTDLYQQPFPSIDWREYPHVTDTVIFQTAIQQHFQRPVEAGEEERFLQQYLHRLTEARQQEPFHFREIPGARELLEYLQQQQDVLLGIATGGWAASAELKLRHVGIRLGEHLPVSAADGHHTREAIIGHALGIANNRHPEISRVVYVGDAIWDVETTRQLNMDFVGIRHRGDHHVLRQIGANTVIETYNPFEIFWSAVQNARPPALPINSQSVG